MTCKSNLNSPLIVAKGFDYETAAIIKTGNKENYRRLHEPCKCTHKYEKMVNDLQIKNERLR